MRAVAVVVLAPIVFVALILLVVALLAFGALVDTALGWVLG